MIEATKVFRRLKARKSLPSLRAALLASGRVAPSAPALTLSARLHSLLNRPRPPRSFQHRPGVRHAKLV